MSMTSISTAMTGLNQGATYYLAVRALNGDSVQTALSSTLSTTTRNSGSGPDLGSLAAYPGCEGMGCAATGGRGGTVYTVNTLADTTNAGCAAQNGPSGPTCSLRDALMKSGARTVVFSVGGTITLGSPIYPPPGNLTVAGQTAPGGGIQVRGDGTFGTGGAMIHFTNNADNVVLRYLRLRPGNAPINASLQGLSALSGGDGIHADLRIVDHCSFEWDGNKACAWGGIVTRTTLSWNLWAEGMSPHSTGLLLNAVTTNQAGLDGSSFDGHHNVFATIDHRLPYTNSKYLRWINNLVFGFAYAMLVRGNAQSDIIGNVWDGVSSGLVADPNRQEVRWAYDPAHNEGGLVPGGSAAQFYMSNNFGHHNPNGALDDYTNMLRIAASENSQCNAVGGVCVASDIGVVDPQYKSAGAVALPAGLNDWPITISNLAARNDLRSLLTPTAGAYRRLACDGSWVLNRDSADTMIVDYIMNPALSPTALVSTEGTYPTLAAGTPCADADGDGMPDLWEDSHGLNQNDAADRNTIRANAHGYTNLELYISGLFPNGTALP
jgi:CSLREA domain-containing protein